MSRCSRLWRTLSGLLIAVATAFLAGCGGEPTPPRLVHFSPVVLLVPTDATIAVRVEYERNDYELTRFAWTVEAGEVEGDGAEIVYTAPSEPGDYQINVTAAYGEGEKAGELSLAGVIKVIPGASRLVSQGLVAQKIGGPAEKAQPAAPPGPAEEGAAGIGVGENVAPQEDEGAPAGDASAEQLGSPQPAKSQTAEVEAYRERIGDDPSRIKVGMSLVIPK